VVTTVDTVIEQNGEAETHAVVRFASVLLPGQSSDLSSLSMASDSRFSHPPAGGPDRDRPIRRPGVTTIRKFTPAQKDMKMKHSKALLLDYLASVRDPERAASLFADDGFQLPFLRSLGVEPRYTAAARSQHLFKGCSKSIPTSRSRLMIPAS